MTNFAINYGGKLLSGELPEVNGPDTDGEYRVEISDDECDFYGGDLDELKSEVINSLAVIALIEGSRDAAELVKVDAAAEVIYESTAPGWAGWDSLLDRDKEPFRVIARKAAQAALEVG